MLATILLRGCFQPLDSLDSIQFSNESPRLRLFLTLGRGEHRGGEESRLNLDPRTAHTMEQYGCYYISFGKKKDNAVVLCLFSPKRCFAIVLK